MYAIPWGKAMAACCPASQVAPRTASGRVGGTVGSHKEQGLVQAKGLAGRASLGSQENSSPVPAAWWRQEKKYKSLFKPAEMIEETDGPVIVSIT